MSLKDEMKFLCRENNIDVSLKNVELNSLLVNYNNKDPRKYNWVEAREQRESVLLATTKVVIMNH